MMVRTGSVIFFLLSLVVGADSPPMQLHTTDGRTIIAASIAHDPARKLLTVVPPATTEGQDPDAVPLPIAQLMAVGFPAAEETASGAIQFTRKHYPGEWRLPTAISDGDAINTSATTTFEVAKFEHEGKPTIACFAGSLLIPVTGDWTFRAIAPDLLGLVVGKEPQTVITPESVEGTGTITLEAGQQPIQLTVPANKKRIYQIEVVGPGVKAKLADLMTAPRHLNRVHLTDGSRITGTISELADDLLTLNTVCGPMRLKPSTMARFEPDLPQARRLLDAAAGNLVLVGNKDRLVELPAAVAGLSKTHLLVDHDGRERKISLGRLAGFTQSHDPAPPAPATVRLVNGDRLHGRLVKIDAEVIELATTWQNGNLRVPISKVGQLLLRPPGCLFLTDLEPIEVVERAWFDNPVSWRRNAGFTAPEPRLGRRTFGHALALHAHTTLRYAAADADGRLLATVGIEEPAPTGTATAVAVRVGDAVVASKPDLRPGKPWQLDVAVPAGSTMALEVDFGPYEDIGDRVIFGNPRLLFEAGGGQP